MNLLYYARRFTKPIDIAIKYGGNNVECPCCGGKFKQYLPYGRPDVMCPKCGSFERHRLLTYFLRKHTDVFSKRISLLHIAPEECLSKIFSRHKNIDYITADLYMEGVKIKMDITDIKFPDNSFDVIMCNHVLEHIPDDLKAMRELRRVLKTDGFAILQVPILREKTFEDFSVTTPEERKRVFGQDDHVRIYGHDYKDRLVNTGFSVDEKNIISGMNPELVKRYGFMEKETIYYCTK
jgi:SAM-dependent methyltransferase